MSKMLTELAKPRESTSVQQRSQESILFSHWLAKQTKRGDQIGELSRSVRLDHCWPRNALDYVAFRNHLRIIHSECPITRIMALDVAWEEFATFKNKAVNAAARSKTRVY
jgi:YozE SAM-like fold